MTRLEKKCALASVVLHGLLLVLLAFGVAFKGKPEPITFQRINVIPTRLIDAALAGGGGNPSLPRTDEQVKGNTTTPVPPAPEAPPAPKPVERLAPVAPPLAVPPRVEPRPAPTPVRPVPVAPPKPAVAVKPVAPVRPAPPAKAPTTPPKTILDSLVPTVRGSDKAAKDREEAQAREVARVAARQAAADHVALANRLGNVTAGLKAGFESGTKVEVGGTGGEAYANYSFLVQTIYDAAWQVLPDLASQDFIVPVEVVIGRDGRIISQRIITRSSNTSMDRSVQRALDKVKATGLAPFPEGARDTERSFRINFNLKARRQAG